MDVHAGQPHVELPSLAHDEEEPGVSIHHISTKEDQEQCVWKLCSHSLTGCV